MKKSYLFLTLAAILEVTSCTAHFSKKIDDMVTINGVSYTLDDVFKTYGGTSKSASSYYEVLKNIYIQLAEPRTSAMNQAVDATFKSEYTDAADRNAKNNNTSVKEEKEKILQSKGVDTEEQYRDQLYLAQQKDSLTKRFALTDFLSNKDGAYDSYFKAGDNLTSNQQLATSSPLDQYIQGNHPYHVRHILVKVDGSDKFRSEISADQAKKITNVVRELAESGSEPGSLTFGQIASELTEDDGSKNQFGDAGLMDKVGKYASFVNEFRFGTYAYDMYFNSSVDSNAVKTALLPSSETNDGVAVNALTNNGNDFPRIYGSSYLETLIMGKLAEKTKLDNTSDIENGNAKNYPRNVLFSNNYNYHGLGMIYVEDPVQVGTKLTSLDANYGLTQAEVDEIRQQLTAAYNNPNNKPLSDPSLDNVRANLYHLQETTETATATNPNPNNASIQVPVVREQSVSTQLGLSNAKIVFADTASGKIASPQPVLVTRVSSSYEGVHFINVIKDPFVAGSDMRAYLNLDITTSTQRNESGAFQTNDYINYIDFGNNAVTSYQERQTKITDGIKGRDTNTAFAESQYIQNLAESKGNTVTLGTDSATGIDRDQLVRNYVENTIATNVKTAQTSYDSAWLTYVQGLTYQRENFSDKKFGTLGYSSINSFNQGVIGKYIANATTAADDVYAVTAEDGKTYYTTNTITKAARDANGIIYNPVWISSTGTSGGTTGGDTSGGTSSGGTSSSN